MSGPAILRILARVKDTRCPNPARYLSRRRSSLHQAGEPGGSTGSDGRVVRQISAITRYHLPLNSLILTFPCVLRRISSCGERRWNKPLPTGANRERVG